VVVVSRTVAAPLVVVGAILVVAVSMSSCGLMLHRFSGCMTAASELFQILALAELGLAVAIFTQGASIDRFLRDHQDELEMRYEAGPSLSLSFP
jgi:hypothetical protein